MTMEKNPRIVIGEDFKKTVKAGMFPNSMTAVRWDCIVMKLHLCLGYLK